MALGNLSLEQGGLFDEKKTSKISGYSPFKIVDPLCIKLNHLLIHFANWLVIFSQCRT